MPEHWEVSCLKHVTHITMGQSPSSDDCNVEGIRLPFLQGNADFGATNPVPRSYCDVASKTAFPGDMLLSVRSPVGAINVADQDYGIGRGLTVPNKIEQEFIVSYLSEEVDKTRALTTEAVRVIELLKERRTALISAAVTGKIGVRNTVAEQVAA